MSKYQVRFNEPSKTNKYYIHETKGGYNPCILIRGNSCLGNCTAYALGRFHEWGDVHPFKYRFVNDAADFWNNAISAGLETGKTPRIGAIMCWKNGTGGFGHVAFVEQVIDEKTIVKTDSCAEITDKYGNIISPEMRFRRRKVTKAENWGEPATYTFQGFIYNPWVNMKTVLEYRKRISDAKLTKSYDYNGDGKANMKDLLLLRKSIY